VQKRRAENLETVYEEMYLRDVIEQQKSVKR
jgi:hypothetical protein